MIPKYTYFVGMLFLISLMQGYVIARSLMPTSKRKFFIHWECGLRGNEKRFQLLKLDTLVLRSSEEMPIIYSSREDHFPESASEFISFENMKRFWPLYPFLRVYRDPFHAQDVSTQI